MTSASAARARVLYIVYWGALEPLGQSLVVPAVRRMANEGVALTLITFEKPADLERMGDVTSLRASLQSAGVRWHPLRYHKKPKWPATMFDGITAVVASLRLGSGRKFDIVHARTFVGGIVGRGISWLLGTRFVYHNEGFYPDEQVDGGVWRPGSFAHLFSRRIETFLYDHADAIIVLSQKAQVALWERQSSKARRPPTIVVPSAVDLEVFHPEMAKVPNPSHALSIVYLGSVGFRYRLDDAGRFLVALRRVSPGASLTVVSRADPLLIQSMLDSSGLERSAWSLKSLPHHAVPAELRSHNAGLFFLTEGLSEYGCSPTKIGEYWATGLPVVTTKNVSDTDAIVRAHRVGVVISAGTPEGFEEAARDLLQLLRDGDLAARCRKAAVDTYALGPACERQMQLYSEIAASR